MSDPTACLHTVFFKQSTHQQHPACTLAAALLSALRRRLISLVFSMPSAMQRYLLRCCSVTCSDAAKRVHSACVTVCVGVRCCLVALACGGNGVLVVRSAGCQSRHSNRAKRGALAAGSARACSQLALLRNHAFLWSRCFCHQARMLTIRCARYSCGLRSDSISVQ